MRDQRGRLGDSSAAAELAALLGSSAPVAERREAARLLVELPAQPATEPALQRAARDPDPAVAYWATVGAARVGDFSRRARVQEIARAASPSAGFAGDPAGAELRVRAALALAAAGDGSGLDVPGRRTGRARGRLFSCRAIVITLGEPARSARLCRSC